jgi:hypothetical protein
MSARMAVLAARAAGVYISVDASALVLEAAAPPRPFVLEQLSRHKAAILSMLTPGADGWSPQDWQAHFDERAGIAEFDGNLPRHRAEALAIESCAAEWVRRNGVGAAQAAAALVALGVGVPAQADVILSDLNEEKKYERR